MKLRTLVAAALTALVAACTAMPDQPPAKKAVWLDQNWSNAQRFWYHHESQGTSTFPIPYTWFASLEQPKLFTGTNGMFADSKYLESFGFIPSPKSLSEAEAFGYPADGGGAGVQTAAYVPAETGSNPDGLPVGFARTPYYDPVTGKGSDDPSKAQIGLTCAGCHTGHMTYKGTDIRIDGAPAMVAMDTFSIALVEALVATDVDPLRFDRFAQRVLGINSTPEQKAALKAELKAVIKGALAEAKGLIKGGKSNVTEGFGRLDALNRIGNQVFVTDLYGAKGFDPAVNTAATNAPVNYPQIWNTSWFDWVQYDASIMQPMVRNAGEALGVAAKVNMIKDGDTLYDSSIPVDNLYQMESLLAGPDPLKQPTPGFAGLRSPAWPEEILGDIDTAKAAHGQTLYAELCQGCHLPPVNDPASDVWKAEHRDKYWTPPDDITEQVQVDKTTSKTVPFDTNGERYLKLPEIQVVDVGTDPAQAAVLTARQVEVPCYLGLDDALCAGKSKDEWVEMPFAAALGGMVEKTVAKWYEKNRTPVEQQQAMNGWRPNHLQALMVYKARPLDGVWATAPFLHNGSVPSIYALLSPATERPRSFCVGVREFDPTHIGLSTSCETGTTRIDTSKDGNLNIGHEFRDGATGNGVIGRALEPEERLAVIEYLKTL